MLLEPEQSQPQPQPQPGVTPQKRDVNEGEEENERLIPLAQHLVSKVS
jgi:hypothetical protein